MNQRLRMSGSCCTNVFLSRNELSSSSQLSRTSITRAMALQGVNDNADDPRCIVDRDGGPPQVEEAFDCYSAAKMKARSYQLEMLDESLRRNIIVAVRYRLLRQGCVVQG